MSSDSEPLERDESPAVQANETFVGKHCNELLLSFLTFALIAFGVWVVLGGKRYRAEYASHVEGWRIGSSRSVELTLIREDKTNLACASKHTVAGLRCGYDQQKQAIASLTADKPEMLQPLVTVGGEMLLGAGLWGNADMKHDLPSSRFSVVCNYAIKGVLKSANIRFDPSAPFKPMDKVATLGTLSDCQRAR